MGKNRLVLIDKFRESKVDQFEGGDVIIGGENEVVWLYISVHDALLVAVANTLKNLFDDNLDLIFFIGLSLNLPQKILTLQVLHNQINRFFCLIDLKELSGVVIFAERFHQKDFVVKQLDLRNSPKFVLQFFLERKHPCSFTFD